MVSPVNNLYLEQRDAGAIGRARGMQRLIDNDGAIGILAIDHGESFSRRLARLLGRYPSAEEIASEKQRIVRHLGSASTGIVIDMENLPGYVRLGLLLRDVALMIGLPDLPASWSLGERLPWPGDVVARTAAAGCEAIKLCIPVDTAELDQARLDIAMDMSARCSELGIAFVLEIVPSEDLRRHNLDRRWPTAVDGNAAQFAAEYGKAGADILKLHIPAGAGRSFDAHLLEACSNVTDNAPCPWVILSAGVTFEVFRHQLEIACRGGASGFVAGTAIWQEALEIPDEDARDAFLVEVARPRLRALRETALTCAPGRPSPVPPGPTGHEAGI
jgi:tagatose 1,6-diphosphate aldolase